MYGTKVNQAAMDAKEQELVITIHQVNQEYDKGRIIFQVSCPVIKGDTPESLAARIHELEHEHYPKVIEEILTKDEDEEWILDKYTRIQEFAAWPKIRTYRTY